MCSLHWIVHTAYIWVPHCKYQWITIISFAIKVTVMIIIWQCVFLFQLFLNCFHLDFTYIILYSSKLELNLRIACSLILYVRFLRPNSILNPIEIRTNSSVHCGWWFKSAKLAKARHTHDAIHAVRFCKNSLQRTATVTLQIIPIRLFKSFFSSLTIQLFVPDL